jgi:tRNA G10  N-methylase Trm11
MFSFVGDTVLDPFLGTGTTAVAAATWGRSSVGFEVDPEYALMAQRRLASVSDNLFAKAVVTFDVLTPRPSAAACVADGPAARRPAGRQRRGTAGRPRAKHHTAV